MTKIEVEVWSSWLNDYITIPVWVEIARNGQINAWKEDTSDPWLGEHEPVDFDLVEATCTKWFGYP